MTIHHPTSSYKEKEGTTYNEQVSSMINSIPKDDIHSINSKLRAATTFFANGSTL